MQNARTDTTHVLYSESISEKRGDKLNLNPKWLIIKLRNRERGIEFLVKAVHDGETCGNVQESGCFIFLEIRGFFNIFKNLVSL